MKRGIGQGGRDCEKVRMACGLRDKRERESSVTCVWRERDSERVERERQKRKRGRVRVKMLQFIANLRF